MQQQQLDGENNGAEAQQDQFHRQRHSSKRPEGWRRPRRPRSEDGNMNLVGQTVKTRRLALGLTRAQFITDLSNVTEGRWSPSAADLLNIERRTRTVTDIELSAFAKALRTSVSSLLGEQQQRQQRQPMQPAQDT